MTDAARIKPAGESALVVEFGNTADPAHHRAVLALDARLRANPPPGIRELVPTYRSLMVHFDPRLADGESLGARILSEAGQTGAPPAAAARLWRLPACYDPPYGEDLVAVAQTLSLDPETVARRHAGERYTVVMYGFAPGFVFLSGLPEELTIPRRATPRPPAPPGALTIAAGQTLIASIPMPTGWYVLGRTPARTFLPGRDPPFPIAIGDSVSFERVDRAAFDRLEASEAAGGDCLLAAGTPC